MKMVVECPDKLRVIFETIIPLFEKINLKILIFLDSEVEKTSNVPSGKGVDGETDEAPTIPSNEIDYVWKLPDEVENNFLVFEI